MVNVVSALLSDTVTTDAAGVSEGVARWWFYPVFGLLAAASAAFDVQNPELVAALYNVLG